MNIKIYVDDDIRENCLRELESGLKEDEKEEKIK